MQLRQAHGSCTMSLITLRPKKLFDKAVTGHLFSLQYVPNWFVTQQAKIWHDEGEYHDDDEIIKWYKSDEKRKAQKAKIEEGLICIA